MPMIDGGYAVAGAVTGFVVGLTGVGGGALMTPILLLFFGVAPITAIASDLWFAAITKLVAAHVHHNSGQVDWMIARRLWLGSLPVALLVVLAIGWGVKVEKVAWLTQAIAILVITTAVGLVLAPKLLRMATARHLGNRAKFKAMQPAVTILSGAALGLSVALTSVGAGALGSVILTYLYPLRMTPRRLVATDIVHAIPLAVFAGAGYLYAGMVDWRIVVNLLLGSVPATIIGSLLAQQFDQRFLKTALAVVLLFVGVKMLV